MKIRRFIAPTTWYEYILEAGALFFLILSIGYFIYFWFNAPEIVPIHFNFKGQADNYGSKTTLIILPIINIAVYVLLTVAMKYLQILNIPVKITIKNQDDIYKIAIKMTRTLKPIICAMLFFILWYVKTFDGTDGSNKIFMIVMATFIIGIFLCLTFWIIKMILIEDKQ
jgi:uncharacterized membrane protein